MLIERIFSAESNSVKVMVRVRAMVLSTLKISWKFNQTKVLSYCLELASLAIEILKFLQRPYKYKQFARFFGGIFIPVEDRSRILILNMIIYRLGSMLLSAKKVRRTAKIKKETLKQKIFSRIRETIIFKHFLYIKCHFFISRI